MMPVLPDPSQIDHLLAFLPRLYAEGVSPHRSEDSGSAEGSVYSWVSYTAVLAAFFAMASKECWADHEYCPEETREMLLQPGFVESAGLAELRTGLTYCVRCERCCDGFWVSMIEQGHIRRILQRLAVLRASAP